MKTLLIVLTLAEVAILVVVLAAYLIGDRRDPAQDLPHPRPRHLRGAGDREADRADRPGGRRHQRSARAGRGRARIGGRTAGRTRREQAAESATPGAALTGDAPAER